VSTWRTVTRALYELGGAATVEEIECRVGGICSGGDALAQAALHGLVKGPGKSGGGNLRPWHLTQKGIDWCEGRLRERQGPKKTGIPGAGRMRWFPTWLSSLPRGIRITTPETLPC
jgi:hypothetical protein